MRISEPRACGQRARSPAHPCAPDRQDGDDHHPEVPGGHRRRRRRAAWFGPSHVVRGRQHLRHGGRGPPHPVPEPRREHAPGAAQRLLPRLHRHPHRQEGPEHAAHLRPLHRHLHHRAGGPGRGDGAHLLREPAPGAADHRADHRPGLRPRLRRTAPRTNAPSSSSASPPSRRSPAPPAASRRSAWTSSTTSLGSSPPTVSRPRWSRRAVTPRSPTRKRWTG